MITAKKHTYKQLLASTLRENANSYLINELIARYPNPVALVDVTEQELLNIKGIGVSKAKQIVAAVQLVREFTAPLPAPVLFVLQLMCSLYLNTICDMPQKKFSSVCF